MDECRLIRWTARWELVAVFHSVLHLSSVFLHHVSWEFYIQRAAVLHEGRFLVEQH